jgi:hypothetical protein
LFLEYLDESNCWTRFGTPFPIFENAICLCLFVLEKQEFLVIQQTSRIRISIFSISLRKGSNGKWNSYSSVNSETSFKLCSAALWKNCLYLLTQTPLEKGINIFEICLKQEGQEGQEWQDGEGRKIKINGISFLFDKKTEISLEIDSKQSLARGIPCFWIIVNFHLDNSSLSQIWKTDLIDVVCYSIYVGQTHYLGHDILRNVLIELNGETFVVAFTENPQEESNTNDVKLLAKLSLGTRISKASIPDITL